MTLPGVWFKQKQQAAFYCVYIFMEVPWYAENESEIEHY